MKWLLQLVGEKYHLNGHFFASSNRETGHNYNYSYGYESKLVPQYLGGTKMDKSICGPLCLRIFDPFPISQPADSHLVVAVELKSAETAKFAGLPWPWTKPWGERPNFTMVHDTKISIVYGVYKLYI
jgi:hypothetical protein